MLEKAATLPADEVFLDLEDAVAPELKNDATRQQVVAALRELEWLAPTRVVRVNGVHTQWCLDDLLTVVSGARDALDAVMLPKVEGADEIQFVAHLLEQLERKHGIEQRIGIEVQIESPLGLVEIERVAAASDRVETLILGPGDYAASAGMPQLTVGEVGEDASENVWHYVLARIVTAARAFGLQAIDGPYAAIADLEGLAVSARRSRALGFDGKWAIHPSQLALCNEVYAPNQEAFDRASRIVDAYRVATDVDGSGAVVFEGEMIDEASRKMALSIVERGRAAGMAPSPAAAREVGGAT